MSKQDRAAQAIEHATKRGYSPEQTARLLSKFNLLAPDMPEPQEHGREIFWPVEEPEGWSVSLRDGWMRLCDNLGMVFAVDILTARDLGYAILAAANHAEGHPWLDYPDSLECHPGITVHGGITYEEDQVIGFDTAHACDAWHPQSESARLTPELHRGHGHVWEENEVIEETKRLAEQAVAAQHEEEQ